LYTISIGFKYLGYIIKVDSYKATDWNWLVAKVEKKLDIGAIDGSP
jgi:hypothetical protein